MKIQKLKIIQIFSNGSINFTYKSFNNLTSCSFLEKDIKNFYLNLKKNHKILINTENFYSYKNKYLK